MTLIERLWLNLEYRMHRVDEYLAAMRGDAMVVADCSARAGECQRRLTLLAINRRYGRT